MHKQSRRIVKITQSEQQKEKTQLEKKATGKISEITLSAPIFTLLESQNREVGQKLFEKFMTENSKPKEEHRYLGIGIKRAPLKRIHLNQF